MNPITISLKETLRKGISNEKIHCSCQISESDFLLCTDNHVYHYSKLKESNNLKAYNYAFRTCAYIKELNSICSINASLPNISFYSLRSGFPLICESYRLSSTLYDTILYSPSTKKLIVAGGSIEIFDVTVEWKLFEVDPQIILHKKLSIPCSRMTSNIYLDEFRQILIVPTLFGFSTYDLLNLNTAPSVLTNRVYQCNHISNLPFQTVAFYNSSKPSTKTSTEHVPFKKLLTTNSNGEIYLWNSSSCRNGHPIQKFEKFNETPVFCEFIDNEFVLFVTENYPNYFVILFDIKTSKSIKLCSFESKVLKMNVMSKLFVSFLTESYLIVYKINIPWHLYTKTSSNSVSIKRYPVYSNALNSSTSMMKAARLGILCSNSIFSIYSPDVHFLLTEIGIPESAKIVDVIYDRESSLRIRERIISIDNKSNNVDYFQPVQLINGKLTQLPIEEINEKTVINSPTVESTKEASIKAALSSPLLLSKDSKNEKIMKFVSTLDTKRSKERVIFLLDNGSFHVYHSLNHKFIKYTESNPLNLQSFLMTYIMKSEGNSLEPTFFGVTKKNELMFFDFNSFDVTSRIILQNDELKANSIPLFTLIHHQTNTIYILYEKQMIQIDSSSKQIFHSELFESKPIFASLEDNLLLIAFENRSIRLRHLKKQQAGFVYEKPSDAKKKEETIKFFEDVTFATVQYETFLIVTDNKTVRVGHSFENCATFEFPFNVYSAGFLNPDLDMLIGLNNEIMVIKRAFWYPFIEKKFDCIFDTSDVNNESVISNLSSKAHLYELKQNVNGLFQSMNDIDLLAINSEHRSLNISKSMANFQTSPKLITRKFVKIPDLPPVPQARSAENSARVNDEREKTMADEEFKKLFGDINRGLSDSPRNSIKTNTNDTHHFSINYESKHTGEISEHIQTDHACTNSASELNHKKVRKKRRVSKRHAFEDNSKDGAILSPQPPSEPQEKSSYHRNQNILQKDANLSDTEKSELEKSTSSVNEIKNELALNSNDKSNETNSCIKNETSNQPNETYQNDPIQLDQSQIKNSIETGTDCNSSQNENLINESNQNEKVVNRYCTFRQNDDLLKNETSLNQNTGDNLVNSQINEQSAESTCENQIDQSNENIESVINKNQNFPNREDSNEDSVTNQLLDQNSKCEKINSALENNQTRQFIPLSKAQSEMTMSSPDLILLQSKLGRLKLSVNKTQPMKSSTPSGKDKLSSIRVIPVKRNIQRTRSEFQISKPNELHFRKNHLYAIPKNDIIIDSNERAGYKQIFVSAIQKVLSEKPLAIKPLIIERDQSDYQKRSPRTKRNLLMGIKKVGIHPLGNVELSLSIIKPAIPKK